jgi:hypothetical protein
MIMGLLKYAIAAGLGYALGRPEGRAQLARVGRQAADLTQRPEVAQLRERGKELATDQAQKVRQKVASRSDSSTGTTATGTDTAAGTTATGPDATGGRLGLRNAAWRSRFSRSRNVHFPASEDVPPVPTPPLAGTTVEDDSHAAVAGATATPRPTSPSSTGTTP